MRFSVVHSTLYRYSAPVRLEPHTLRLQPRCDGVQRISQYQVQILPRPAGCSSCIDQDGNAVTETWFDAETESLSVQSSFQVETLRENPFDFILPPPYRLKLPLEMAGPLGAALAPYVSRPVDAESAEFAHGIASEADAQTMPFLSLLSERLFGNWRQVVRKEGPPLPPAETLRTREGSCRDLAVLFAACCREVGIPARFVSGYERESANLDHAYMHAWVEVYLPGGGWRGYDPARGLAVATSHVAVAAAVDPALAAPITGSYRGTARSEMTVSILMDVGQDSG